MSDYTPIILIELVLVFGGAVLFAWWQLHSIKVDRRKAAERRAAEEAQRQLSEAQAAQAAQAAQPASGGAAEPSGESPPPASR
jgi:hypothetical protein